MLIKIFEFLSALFIMISITMVIKSYKWWILYVASCVLYIVVMFHSGLAWYALMGIYLFITGIRNYTLGKKKDSPMKMKRK